MGADVAGILLRMPCPACDAQLVWRQNGAWCDRCHRKVETCCEGSPQVIASGALSVSVDRMPSADPPGRASVTLERKPTNHGGPPPAFGVPLALHPHRDCLPDATPQVERV